jgi:hypothetical protein
MLRRLSSVKWVHLSVRPKSTAVAPESPQAPKEGEGPGLFRSASDYLRSGGREDLSAIGIGVGGLAVGASAIYYIVGSVQSSHEKISILTKDILIERELRAKDNESAEKLRIEGIESAEKLRAMDIQKERELREKDAAIMRAERIAFEQELRAAKLELKNARGK